MELVEFDALPAEIRADLHGNEVDAFDAARLPPISWRPKTHHVVARSDDGLALASAGTLVVEVEVADERFEVIGVGGVLVKAEYRGRGLARTVVAAVLARASDLGLDFALLFCHDDRSGLYEKLGFTRVGGPVTVEQPGGPLVIPQVTMWRALRPGADWPAGPLRVLGLPF